MTTVFRSHFHVDICKGLKEEEELADEVSKRWGFFEAELAEYDFRMSRHGIRGMFACSTSLLIGTHLIEEKAWVQFRGLVVDHPMDAFMEGDEK